MGWIVRLALNYATCYSMIKGYINDIQCATCIYSHMMSLIMLIASKHVKGNIMYCDNNDVMRPNKENQGDIQREADK